MEDLEFRVSSKAARLIGRENIAAVDGAIIELVKNSYDADAECVYIKYDMPFPNIPKQTTISYLKNYLNNSEIESILKFYKEEKNKLVKKEELKEDDEKEIRKILLSKNKIILLDNGIGMTKETMKTTWMNIATSDKEKNIYSDKGRIKTGAKGIGRFALEKLSMETKVYTKNAKDTLIEWNIDWKQFENLELLNQIKATMNSRNEEYQDIVKKYIGIDEFNKIKRFSWNSGTLIILSPTREEWNDRLFKKVNVNMQSINPLGSVDTFEVHINNIYNQELNFISNNLEVQDYDYRIKADYDGDNNIKVKLKRNEIDLIADEAKIIVNNKEYSFDLKEFWNREAFKKKNYNKEDYDKEIEINLVAKKELKNYEFENIKKIGPFSMIFYFMKKGNSDDSIIKKIKVKQRNELLNKFSGIKLYRDNFKVRPYGELDDGMYDWLNLGLRAQRSPAGVKHPSGDWRVLPYQTIGCVMIGRNENPKLTDMANREGLASNEEYYIFVEMIQKILEAFEYDRQYVYREYGKWLDSKIKKIDKTERIVESIKDEKKREEYKEDEDEYTKSDYREAVKKIEADKKERDKTKEILMAFGSSGILTNTFSHELNGIETQIAIRMPYLRYAVRLLLDMKDYKGDEDYDPLEIINEVEKTDQLLQSWISVVINGVKREAFEEREIDIIQFIKRIEEEWNPLLNKKHIIFDNKEIEEKIMINIEQIDLYSIFNNFILNSAWFLEKSQGKQRKIKIKIKVIKNEDIEIILENNGPSLDEKYKDNPDRIFNAGETSKGDNGTGLGLWIMRECVIKNEGEINVIDKSDGFGIKIKLPM